MKNKRAKSTRFGSNRKKVVSDVSPSTSIPPLVEGQVRCFLRATVSRVLWTVAKPPLVTLVRLRWWGESTSGTLFCPKDGSQARQKDVKSTTRFPVRCGPKQFTSYLTDMGSLVLDVLTKPDHLPIARVQIAGIARLSLSHTINGFFTLVSPTSEKLGELQVTLALEPLTENYDSSSSVPTTDISTDVPVSVPELLPPPAPSHRPASGGSSNSTPRGKDHLYFQEKGNTPFIRELAMRPDDNLADQNSLPVGSRALPHPAEVPEARGPDVQSHSAHRGGALDLLSVLLERGSKLSNAMVISALKSDIDSDMALKDTPFPLPRDNAGSPPLLPLMPSSGQFLQDILHADLQSSSRDHELRGPEGAADPHGAAVDLLLGSVNGSVLPLWDGEAPSLDSLSGCSSLDSEFGDPQYDQSLLESLFYRAPADSCLNPVEDECPSKRSLDKNDRPTGDSGENMRTKDGFSGLSVDRIALLGRIHLARVNILQLVLPPDNTSNTPRKLLKKGRPPLPLATKKCSYFVEYLFPLPSSDNNELGLARPAEVTRVVSRKIVAGAVNFQQRSVFPVHLDGPTIKRWWDTNLTFRIYCRKNFQKKPVPIGTAELPLRCVLQSEGLNITTALVVQRLEDNPDKQEAGPLKVSFELAEGKRDFSSQSRSGKGAARAGEPPRRAVHQGSDVSPGPQGDDTGVDVPSVHEQALGRDSSPRAPHPARSILMPRSRSRSASPRGGGQRSAHAAPPPREEEWNDVLLHVLLVVPDGRDFSCAPMQPNVYLNCRLIGSEETTRSTVSWGQTHPTFNLVQVAPLALTSRLLERMRNNVMVIEVWLRASTSDNDKLLGLVKLPLHQFYMSFRDSKISQLLLQAQYPVVAVDSYIPVVDIFTGGARGSLRVCLAMGLAQQITALQRTRDQDLCWTSQPPRPAHLLDQRPAEHTAVSTGGDTQASGVLTEHVFVLRVEGVKGLTPLQSTVWGEADCYTQYLFPTQEKEDGQLIDPHTVESTLDLKSYRTASTLCVPDPVFGHCETHALLAPPGVPVQRLLLSSLASQGLSNGGGIQFEVWCRYYYPNVREQLAARATLPMAKLCAMVTMQGRSQAESQRFSLPLIPRTDGLPEPRPSGLLEVTVQYKSRPMRSSRVKSGSVTPRVVTLLVTVHRAAGLQAAARALALPYYSEVGVNSLVSVQLSFLPVRDIRSTRAVARSFCPEFQHHAEFCCPLVLQREGGESVSLAELLQDATAIFTVYHRDTRKAVDALQSKDSVLGSVRIRLAALLHKRTGVSGWHALSPPPGLPPSLTSLGGLELSLNFAHHADRERVLRSAQLLGWESTRAEDEDEDDDDDDEEEDSRPLVLSVSVPRVWLPVHSLLLPGHGELQRSTYCYYRYKLYEKEAFCSGLSHPALGEGEGQRGLVTLAFPSAPALQLRRTQPLRWYLREERLEVQLWVSFGKGKRERPHDSDRLVGSAFIDLSALAASSKHKRTISGVYPLFKRSAADLGGATLRAHITVATDPAPYTAPPSRQEEVEQLSDSGEEEENGGPSCGQSHGPDDLPHSSSRGHGRSDWNPEVLQESHSTEPAAGDTFTATVIVERAMHLSLKGCPVADRGGCLPSCCVSYATADAPGTVTTAVIQDNPCPVWGHQQDSRFSKELLVDPQQLLVFKVWHKGEVERVIGFASVDLSPLLSGFPSVCGWYNITDFSGQCQGQIKVAVSPLVGVQELRTQRQAACKNSTPDSSSLFSALPLCYQTTATYKNFPSHISRFSEQRISSPGHLPVPPGHLPVPPGHLPVPPGHLPVPSARSPVTDRHDEHLDNVRRFHQAVQEGESGTLPSSAGHAQPSSSALFSALRKNLSELDDIQRYFSRKLSTPVFPVLTEQSPDPSGEEPQALVDCPQLLLKTNQLVGEVNSIITDLSEHQHEPASSSSYKDQAPTVAQPEVYVLSGEVRLTPAESESGETETCSQTDPENRLDDISNLTSPVSEESTHSSIPEDLHHDQCSNEDEDKRENETEEEEDEEFEETLIEPRALNEVTSVTDRTSPWTSVLSDPDLDSLESVEMIHPAGDQTSPVQEKLKNTAAATSPTPSLPQTSEPADSDLSNRFESIADTRELTGLCKDLSDEEEFITADLHEVHSDEEEFTTAGLREDSTRGIQQTLHHVQHDSMSDSDDSPLLPSTGPSAKGDTVETQPKLCDAVEIPNFFLPSHHLEASMRALRLAPVFPSPSSGRGTVKSDCTYRRAARPKAAIPPSSAKKEETKRIAKIFASHFTERS